MPQALPNIEPDAQNLEMQHALQILTYTRRSLFLTGKAGTGKSTFLRYICEHIKKKHVVLAPTGIAAINAGGATMHSFFRLPFHPLLPDDRHYDIRHIKDALKYNREKVKIIREVELIIIDEISMVRADIIDFVDKVLRVYSRNMREPFGGKQMLFVGDVFQLEPVVREEDWQLLRPYYPSAFFFSAHVFRQLPLVSIELKKVYRQSDPVFISILDHIRQGTANEADLRMLNRQTAAQDGHSDFNITLSTRRDTVDYINEKRLAELPGQPVCFMGEVEGEFPENSLPTPRELYLKPGGQVIFIKNDMERRWVNGTLGVVSAIDEEKHIIYVNTDDGAEYEVEPERWSNMRYTFNEEEKKIQEEEIGTYVQFPLRLAWAITVHKSQGLTFKHVSIDFTGGVFAGGQTYVALSRCTSLSGIQLKEPIRREDIFVKNEVRNFAQHFNDNNLIAKAMSESKADREYHEAVRAFDRHDFDTFLSKFFAAIHSRYDIETPLAKRFIRKKLSVIHQLSQENENLKTQLQQQQDFLRELAAEYVIMAKECEHEHMDEAALANYRKALRLYPGSKEIQRRMQKIEKRVSRRK